MTDKVRKALEAAFKLLGAIEQNPKRRYSVVEERALIMDALGELKVHAEEWYCEDHPEHKMGHDGCKGAGVLESCRLGLQTRHLRFARQDQREAEKMRDEMGAHARRLASELSKKSEDAELLSWLCDSENIYWIHVQAEPDKREVFNSSLVGNFRAALRAAKDTK